MFSDFRQKVEIFNPDMADQLRRDYINSFVETTREGFTESIATYKKCVDGYCYQAYLWDFLLLPKVIPYSEIENADTFAEVFVLWDIHSQERIFIPDYWKFCKRDVIKLRYADLIENLKYLPEDIYIFDGTLSRTFVLTHEYINNERWCLESAGKKTCL